MQIDFGTFEEEKVEQSLVKKYINQNDRVLEIGGNIGRVSLVLSEIVDNNNLLVLESNYKYWEQLEHNKKLNAKTFHTLPKALSYVPLYQIGWVSTPGNINPQKAYGKMAELQKIFNSIKDKDKQAIRIETITYEEILEQYQIDFNTLVLDCEGAIYYILKSNENILKNIQKVIIENDYLQIEHKKYCEKVFEKFGLQSVERIDLPEALRKWYPDPYIYSGFYEVFIRGLENT